MEEAQQQTEIARLRQELRRVSAILNASPDPVWQRDEQLIITFCNEAFTEIVQPDTVSLMDFSAMELFRGHRDMAKAAQESGEALQEEKYIIVGGKRRLYRICEVPNSDGTVNGYAVDISETEEARDEVQRHITAQRDFLESSNSAMAVFGRDQRLQFFNAAYVRLWNVDEHFLAGRPTYGMILEAMRERRRLPEQANFPEFKQRHISWFTDLLEPHEELFYLPDGVTLRVVIIPHALGGLLFAYEDVTDRLALERSYNTLIAVQQETLDNIYESVVVFGEDGCVKLVNPSFIKLWEVDEFAMTNQPHMRDALELFKHHLYFRDWPAYKQAFMARIHSRENEVGKVELRNGKVLSWRKVALPDGGTLLAHNDITASENLERSLRERNQALVAADKLKTEFLANVSYELRSPLTSIGGFSEVLRNNYFGELSDKQREYVEGIHQSSKQLEALINNILDLASIEAGYMQLELEEFDVYEMVSAILSMATQRGKAMQLELVNQCDKTIGLMTADETRIRQVLFNLLNNAVKYSHEGGKVTLGAYAEGDEIIFTVEDEGVGIEPDKLDSIFERFYREGASSGQQAGTGLGLSIVKSFIGLHGGSVSAKSQPGKGTCFTCHVPRVCVQS